VASGQVRPVIERTYPLEQAADAVRYLGEGHVAGKLVIVN
jgi:NADPH:quinone reductase-like Zn-dependent oxidoreductase